MKRPASSQGLTRRAIVFGAANVAAMSVLLGRLYYLQFVRGEAYKNLAEGNRVKLQLIPPVRGMLLDRYGEVMAENQKNFRLYLDPELCKNAEKTMRELAKVITLSEEDITDAVEEIRESRHRPPLMIKEHLSWDELAQFEFFRLNYPEVYVETGQVRYYPLGEKASHLLGYMGAVAKDEMSEDELVHLPDFKIGKNGIEKMLEARLQGLAGTKETEVNVHGVPVRELGRKEGTPGDNIKLTIDKRLQQYAAARLGDESAAAVVMNVRNGDIVALASMPSFEPNTFSKGIRNKYWKALNDNPRIPLMNKAIAGQYPPGSTFKLAMALAALDDGVTSPEQRIHCGGTFMFGNHPFTCWKPHGHGSMNMTDAIAQSCDVYFYTMAQRMGIDVMAAMARRLGLGKVTGTGMSGELPAIVPDDDWKRNKYDQKWQGGDTINVGIGQGYVLATPIQLAVMTARLATGLMVKPRLTIDTPVPEFEPIGVSSAHLASVQEGMNAVCNTPRGTAYGKRIMDPRFLMAGKTGTSQVRKLIQHGLDQNKLPWEDRHHAWFVGYAPVNAPKYACSVIVEHGGGGASSAAPIVSDILLKIQALDAGEEGPPMPKNITSSGEEETD